ncbi:MAG: DNA polymerase III subunit chi [Burkholderiaceae bacterium]
MTQIDFHVNAPAKLAYACRLARKGFASGSRMVFYANDPALLERFDRELWTFSALAFIPHCHARDALANVTPILLAGPADADACTHHEVLVNLDRQQPEFFSRFDRMIEVVEADDADLEAGRVRWKFYKDRGYPLTRHDFAASAA